MLPHSSKVLDEEVLEIYSFKGEKTNPYEAEFIFLLSLFPILEKNNKNQPFLNI